MIQSFQRGRLLLAAALAWAAGAVQAAIPMAELPARGVKYQRFVSEDAPWSIHVVRIDRSRPNLELVTTLANGATMGLNSMTRQIQAMPKNGEIALAAINGDFYLTERETDTYLGDPRGLQIHRGELVSGPGSSVCFWIDPERGPQMGEVKPAFSVQWADGSKTPFEINEERSGSRAVLYTPAMGAETGTYGGMEFVLEGADGKWLPLQAGEKYTARIREIRKSGGARMKAGAAVLSVGNVFGDAGAAKAAVGDTVIVSTLSVPNLKGVRTAIGGGPALVRDSEVDVGAARKANDRHPRSAVGWNEKEILFVEVDGRQRGLSIGMTLPELAAFMVRLGCAEAMNLDGGGSAEMWLNGRIVSSPCFGHERSTANALVVVEKRPEP